MCGRFTLRAAPEAVAAHFGLDDVPDLSPRHNVAPGQAVATIRARERGGRVCEVRRWGLVPGWARDASIGHRLINARAESVAEKPAFRAAFRRRRCLIPADGFYEWAAGPAPRQPFHVARADGGLFGLAGLWEVWQPQEGPEVSTCTILTTRSNASVARIHDRMPVILSPSDYARWLDPESEDAEKLAPLLAPCPDDWLVLRSVGLRVNDPRHDDPECSAPAPPRAGQGKLL